MTLRLKFSVALISAFACAAAHADPADYIFSPVVEHGEGGSAKLGASPNSLTARRERGSCP